MTSIGATRVREDGTFVTYQHRDTNWAWLIDFTVGIPYEMIKDWLVGKGRRCEPPYPAAGFSQVVIGADPSYDYDDEQPFVWEGPFVLEDKAELMPYIEKAYQYWRAENLLKKRTPNDHDFAWFDFNVPPYEGMWKYDVGAPVNICMFSQNPLPPPAEDENAAAEGELNNLVPPPNYQ